MAFQSVQDTAEVRVIYTLDGETVMNTYHAQYFGPYTQIDLDGLAANIDALAVPGLLALQSSALAYVRTDVVGLTFENDISATNNANAGSGSNGSGSMPGNVAFVVKRLSGLTGRSARGRIYLSGIPRSDVTISGLNANDIDLAFANSFLSAVDTFRTAITIPILRSAVIVSRYNQGAKRAVGATFPWSLTQYTSRRLATMRSRMH